MSPDPTPVSIVLRASQLLHSYGTPAHRLERVVSHLASTFGLEVQVFSTPTSIFISFEGEERDRVRLLRVDPGGVDLGKLVDIDVLLDEIEAGAVSPAEAVERMEALDSAAPRWAGHWAVLGHALAASTAAVFFGGRPIDAALCLAMGALIGVIEAVSARRHGVATLFQPLAAFLAAFGGTGGASVRWSGQRRHRGPRFDHRARAGPVLDGGDVGAGYATSLVGNLAPRGRGLGIPDHCLWGLPGPLRRRRCLGGAAV